jgi:hypothetical protein
MNTNRIAPRILSLALAAIFTASMLAGIDTLAGNDIDPDSLMAQGSADAVRPL